MLPVSPSFMKLALKSIMLPLILLAGTSLQAQLLEDVLGQEGLLGVVNSGSTAVGVDLSDNLDDSGTAEPGSSEDSQSDEIALTSAESADLLTMDEGVLSSGRDQPALSSLTSLDPVFVAGRIQADGGSCPDSDGDGVCDLDDQCLKTPRGIKVLGNGCYLDGPRVQTIEGVLFDYNSAKLSDESKLLLGSILPVLLQSPAQKVELGGHTDDLGGANYNMQLSLRRAQSVRDYLVSLGVNPDRVIARGYGESEPRADNGSSVGRDRNRRVEIKSL
jgi:OOP family OmpA-OmpF porin